MPHLTIEYTVNLADISPDDLLRRANRALLGSGLFDEPDIKSRALCRTHFLVGAGHPGRAYVHARLAMLSGRTDAHRAAVAEAVKRALEPLLERQRLVVQLTVETVEIHAASYAKSIIGA